jgi:hypothetical protein
MRQGDEGGEMTLKQRVDRHDREIDAIRKLVLMGMKLLNQTNGRLDRLVTAHQALAASQRETDRQLQTFIRSMRRGTNGHTKRKLDLQ